MDQENGRSGATGGREASGETGHLWLVATPIGTIEDLSPRATSVLSTADLILAEDTRQLGKLVRAIGIRPGGRILSFHEHNEAQRLEDVLRVLDQGGDVVLSSDAGTPVLSDPGFLLVREARRRGHRVLSVPGPSAFTAALAASGQPPLPALLVGFLPPRRGARRRKLGSLGTGPGTLVFFLSPHRLGGELRDLAEVLGPERPATLLAELSKLHERAIMGSLGELTNCAEVQQPRGEYVLVVGPGEAVTGSRQGEKGVDGALVEVVYREAVRRGYGRAEALRWTASRLGLSRKEVFELLEAPSSPG